jgi:hypothetical protein
MSAIEMLRQSVETIEMDSRVRFLEFWVGQAICRTHAQIKRGVKFFRATVYLQRVFVKALLSLREIFFLATSLRVKIHPMLLLFKDHADIAIGT